MKIQFNGAWKPTVIFNKFFYFIDKDGNETKTANENTIAFEFKKNRRHLGYGRQLILDGMFKGASTLVSIQMPYEWGTQITSMEGFFSGCSSLKNVWLPFFWPKSISNLKNFFEGCGELEHISDTSVRKFNSFTRFDNMFSGAAKNDITLGLVQAIAKHIEKESFYRDNEAQIASLI